MRPGRTASSARCCRPRVAATAEGGETPVEVVDTGGAVGLGVADRDDRSQWRQPAGMERRIVAASHAQRLALGRAHGWTTCRGRRLVLGEDDRHGGAWSLRPFGPADRRYTLLNREFFVDEAGTIS